MNTTPNYDMMRAELRAIFAATPGAASRILTACTTHRLVGSQFIETAPDRPWLVGGAASITGCGCVLGHAVGIPVDASTVPDDEIARVDCEAGALRHVVQRATHEVAIDDDEADQFLDVEFAIINVTPRSDDTPVVALIVDECRAWLAADGGAA